MERIPKTKAEFERLPFMSQISVKEKLVTRNFAKLCDSINMNDLKLFKPVLHAGDFEEIELMRSRFSKSRVAQQLLMDLPRSMKQNPSWFELLDNLLRNTNVDLYYALNPWERRTVGGGASGGGGGDGGGGDGPPQPPAPRGPRGPYPKSTPLSQTRGMALVLRPLCQGGLWRDLADQLDVTHGDQLLIMNVANSQRCDIIRALLDHVIHRRGDGATVDMLVQGLFALEEKGRAVVSSMEEQGLIVPQGREGSEAEGAGLDTASLPYDNVEGGSASAAAMMPPTQRVAHPCSLGTVQSLGDRAPQSVAPYTQSSPTTCSNHSPDEPHQAGSERLASVSDRQHGDTRDRLQRSASELSPRDRSSSNNIPVVSRAISSPAGLTSASLGFSPNSSTPTLTEYYQRQELVLNLDQTPPDSMEENSSQAKTSKEPFIPEDKALNVVRSDILQEPSPRCAHDNLPAGRSGFNLYRQTSVLSGSLQPDSPLSDPVVAVGGETGGERGTTAVIVTASSNNNVTSSQCLSSSRFVSEVIRESQESIISTIERFPGDNITSLPVSSSSQENMQPATSTASGTDKDSHQPLEAVCRKSPLQHKIEAEKNPDQGGHQIHIYFNNVNNVQVGEKNKVIHTPQTPLCPVESPVFIRTSSCTSTDGNVATSTSSCQTLPPPTEASHQSDRYPYTATTEEPPPYSQVMAETGQDVLLQEMPNLCALQAQSSASWDQQVTRAMQPSSTEGHLQLSPLQYVATLDRYGPTCELSVQPAPWDEAGHQTIPKQPLPQDSCQSPFSQQPGHNGGGPGGFMWPSQSQLQPQRPQQLHVEECRAQPQSFGDVIDLQQFRSGSINTPPHHTREEESARDSRIIGCRQFLASETEERACPQLAPSNTLVSEQSARVTVSELPEAREGWGVGGGKQEERGGCGVEGELSVPEQGASTPPQSLTTIIFNRMCQTAFDMFIHRKL